MAHPPTLVSQLRVAVARTERPAAFSSLGALIRASLEGQHLAAYEAGAAPVILEAMDAWPDDVDMQTCCLGALFHCWGGGLSPFDDTALTPRAIEATLEAMKTADLLVCQAGLRLLRCHSVCSVKLFALPAVATAVAEAMVAHLEDATVQAWGAKTMLNLLGIDQKQVVAEHGQYGLSMLHECAIKVAALTRHGTEVTIQGQPWSQVVLQSIFPRLRPR